MKKNILTGGIIAVCLIFYAGCTGKVTPSISGIPRGKNYDSAVFDYIYIEGLRQKLTGNAGEALKYFEQCSRINPDNDAVFYQMAQILFSRGDMQNGKKYALKAARLDPSNLWYMLMLAGNYFQEKKIDSAIVWYEKAVKKFPGKDDLMITLGNLYAEDKRYNDADKVFSELDRKYGINERSTLANIKNQINSGNYDRALGLIEMLLELYPDEILYNGIKAEIFREKGDNERAMEVYNELMKRNPDNPDTQLSLCEFLLNEKKYDELLQLINTVILNGNISREEKLGLFASILEDDEFLKERANELSLAMMILEAAYENDGIIVLLRPELYQKTGRLNDAADRLQEVIKKMPDNYYAWERLLLVYLEGKDYKNLELKGEECALKFNRSFLAKVLYAAGATENKNYNIALEELRKAEILAGDNQEMILQVLATRADVYYRMKEYEKAFGIFEEALRRDAGDLTVLNNYAYYLAEQDMRLKDAEKMARQVIEKEGDNHTFLDTYAWVLYKRGKVREAERVMKEIILSGKKESAEFYEHMGFIKKKRKNCREAVENWKKAMELDESKTELLKEIEKCQ
ncbi:MAG TPA: tetratricopeptide repeat protein [Bacteroidales bacterium]|jgi:tetratricopeptide (TPR) repeat protein|nr:tetratricopeptide repeat protein [Bacteroidales bacterium]HQH23175.1 tetratricopeptide repeat protein [Bacteroidales bacterium]HQJ80967.1 tetratricopeptide repeat protein [Bacteroidales bacterium]